MKVPQEEHVQKKLNHVHFRVHPYEYYTKKKRAEVLKQLSDLTLNLSDIAMQRNVSSSSMHRFFKRLIKDGLITQERELTEAGMNIVHKSVVVSDDVHNDVHSYQKVDTTRLHDLQFKIRILTKKKDYRANKIISMKVNDYKIIDLKNNYQEQFYVNDVKIRTTTKSILVMPSDVYADRPREAAIRALNVLFDVIPKVENLFNIKLIKDKYCNIEISRQHYALIHNELAKLYKKDKKYKNAFKVVDKSLETRLIIDFSQNIPEFEAVHKIHAHDDIEAAKPIFDDLGQKAKPYFDDLKHEEKQDYFRNVIEEKKHYLPSEVSASIDAIFPILKEVAYAQQNQTKLMQALIPKPLKPMPIRKGTIPDYIQ